jgi:hypothetical protein
MVRGLPKTWDEKDFAKWLDMLVAGLCKSNAVAPQLETRLVWFLQPSNLSRDFSWFLKSLLFPSATCAAPSRSPARRARRRSRGRTASSPSGSSATASRPPRRSRWGWDGLRVLYNRPRSLYYITSLSSRLFFPSPATTDPATTEATTRTSIQAEPLSRVTLNEPNVKLRC